MGIAILLLGTLVPGVGEIVENALHLAREGHLAHGAPEGDDHDAPLPEHGCTGTLHLCSCCVSPGVILTQPVDRTPSPELRGYVIVATAHGTPVSPSRVYQPPRA